MLVGGTPYRTIWTTETGEVEIIDQTRLPHEFVTTGIKDVGQAARAIRDMLVRGAPLIGATAAWGMALAARQDPADQGLERAGAALEAARPTAVNLAWAVRRMLGRLLPLPREERARAAADLAREICDQDVATNSALGDHGLDLLKKLYARRRDQDGPLRILTHCNAGWLATVDWGTALAPVYKAHEAGIPLHVFVDETRPRNQGASLTAWELASHGISHQVIVDNAGGHLMQRGLVDCCIVGTDRTTASGDVCNKIGTYLKALAARDNGVPFYVALPGPTIDWNMRDGLAEIPIEERDQDEVRWIQGVDQEGKPRRVRLTPEASPAANPAFDVTPARLVTALITERGVCPASPAGLRSLYPEEAGA